MMKYVCKPMIIMSSILVFTACGGSSSSSNGGTNTAPVADAGADQKGKINTAIFLDGAASSDADSDTLTYSWTVTSAPTASTATLSDADTASPTLIPDVGGQYIVSLIVNDGTDDSGSDSVTITAGVLAADYDPLGQYTNCSATYQWTVGPNSSTSFVTSTAGLETVNYVSGALSGTITNGGRDRISQTTYNDGITYKLLRIENGDGNYFLSTDCSLTALPTGFSFDIIYNGLLVDEGPFYAIDTTNAANCVGPVSQKTVFTIQDVTVQGTTYKDALLVWSIDEDYSYQDVSNARFDSLGIVPPTSEQAGGYSLTDVDISAYNSGTTVGGTIAGGDIDAASGTLNDFAERTAGSCI